MYRRQSLTDALHLWMIGFMWMWGLEALGVEADQFGSFLIPIIMTKLFSLTFHLIMSLCNELKLVFHFHKMDSLYFMKPSSKSWAPPWKSILLWSLLKTISTSSKVSAYNLQLISALRVWRRKTNSEACSEGHSYTYHTVNQGYK